MRVSAAVYFTIVLIMMCTPAYAQKTVHFGLNYGFSSSNFYTSSDRNVDFDNRWGLSIGGFLDFRLAEVINFQPEIHYTQRGSSVTITPENKAGYSEAAIRAIWETSYLEIPLLIRVTFPYEVRFKPHILFGPSLNFLSKSDVSNSDIILAENMRTLHNFDLATVFGAGTSYTWSYPGELFFDIRYMLGTTIIHEFFDVVLKNEGLSLNLGYRFNSL